MFHGKISRKSMFKSLYITTGLVLGFITGFVLSTGIWLLSQTEYPYWRTVGGGTLLITVLGAIIGALVED